jgi:hypothetical protein
MPGSNNSFPNKDMVMNKIQRSINGRAIILFAIAACAMAGAARAQGNGDDGVITAVGSDVVMRSVDGGRTWFQVPSDAAERARGEMARAVGSGAGEGGVRATIAAGAVRIAFRLDRPGRVMLALADMSGASVALVDEGLLAAGDHLALLPLRGIRAGCYYCAVLNDGRMRGVKILITQ